MTKEATLVQTSVETILASVQSAIQANTDVVAAINDSSVALLALVPLNEVDRVHQQIGLLRLMDILVELVPDNETLAGQRAQIAEAIQRRYGSEKTPYLRSRTIVEETAARFADGGEHDEVVAAALAEIAGLELDAADMPAKATAIMAVQSLNAARQFLADPLPESDMGGLVASSLRMLDMALRIGGFDRDAVMKSAQGLRKAKLSLDGTPAGQARALLIVLGLGLRCEATALTALEAVCDLLVEALNEVNQAPASEPTFGDRCDAVIARFEQDVTDLGFSEHLLNQGIADLRALETCNEEEARALRTALVRLFDSAIPHAPDEGAQVLQIARDGIMRQDEPAQVLLDAAGVRLEAESILKSLREELAAGGLPGPACMRALTALQSLAPRIRDDEALRALMELMPQLMTAILSHAGEDKLHLAEDMDATMQRVFAGATTLLDAGPVDGQLTGRAMMRDMSRLTQIPTADPFEQADAPEHHRQFASFVRLFSNRLVVLRERPDGALYDTAEATRIRMRAEVATQRLRFATTEAQWVEQLRGSMRQVFVDLRQFERRYHLMVIDPPWPAQPATVDANALYFTGCADVRPTIDAAMGRLGMTEAVAHGVDDPAHTRWNLLRRSAVAVFDFTGYDRRAADPPGPLPRSQAKREAIARAAAPVARSAYECGWAVVLGVPTLALASIDQAMPFDVDIEPVRVSAGSEPEDVMRTILGVQAVLCGVQRGARVGDLTATQAHLRSRFAGDAEAEAMLDRLAASDDGTEVQLGAESLLERPRGRGAMLAWPAFPPIYPASTGPRSLFHVTAFREWSQPCKEALRTVCRDADIEYRIGHEQIDPDILGLIWRDIAGATFVVADLTQLNPNAALELGIAHALGRPTLLVTQTPDLARHVPLLSKIRAHLYSTDAASLSALTRLVRRFVGATSA
jgi:hypothetical protein